MRIPVSSIVAALAALLAFPHPAAANFVTTFWGGYPINPIWTVGDIAIPALTTNSGSGNNPPGAIYPLDVNGDGRIDFVVTILNGPPIRILLNQGGGNFIDGTSTIFPNGAPSVPNSGSAVIADFNADGRPDIFMVTGGMDASVDGFVGTGQVLLLSLGAHGFVDALHNIPAETSQQNYVNGADIDGNGSIDLFVSDQPANGYIPHFLINNGHGVFSASTSNISLSLANLIQNTYWGASALFDANGDGAPDLFCGQSQNASTSLILFNDGHGNFSEKSNSLISIPNITAADFYMTAALPVDFFNNGINDLVVSAGDYSTDPYFLVDFLVNNGQGTFTDQSGTVVVWTPSGAYTGKVPTGATFFLAAADINNDGYPDIIATNTDQKTVFLNDGSGHYVEMPGNIFPQSPNNSDPHAWLASMAFGDFNGDGLTDAIAYTGEPTGDGFDHFTIFWGTTPPATQNGCGAILGGPGNDTLTGCSTQPNAIFGGAGNDIILGGNKGDYLNGGKGNDTIVGGAGNDMIDGGPGADTLTGGGGKDIFVYHYASDSTSTAYDTITDFNASNDTFLLLGLSAITAIDPTVRNVMLNTGSQFDTELAQQIASGQLGAHSAVLALVMSGNLSGHEFLIVDLNGQPGYQAGQDLVIDVTNITGTLTTANFATTPRAARRFSHTQWSTGVSSATSRYPRIPQSR